jgi:adenine-specific DNA methylase
VAIGNQERVVSVMGLQRGNIASVDLVHVTIGPGAVVYTRYARTEIARELAYRLYTLCERKERAPEALAYNGLVQSFPEIARLAREPQGVAAEQGALFGDGQ